MFSLLTVVILSYLVKIRCLDVWLLRPRVDMWVIISCGMGILVQDLVDILQQGRRTKVPVVLILGYCHLSSVFGYIF